MILIFKYCQIFKYFLGINLFLLLLNNIAFAGFIADMVVTTSSGYSKMTELSVGDYIESFDFRKKVLCKVVCKQSTIEQDCIAIVLNNTLQPIICSKNQKFYVCCEKVWKEAKDLKVGDILLSNGTEYFVIQNLYRIKEPLELFDISVSKKNNFFVSKHNILVHNFAPIVIGVSLGFGGSTVEWLGFFGGIAFLGSLIGFQLHKEKIKQPEIEFVDSNYYGSSGSKSPNDPENEKNKFKISIFESNSKHIFRNAEGHLVDTPVNRELLIELASNPKNLLGIDKFGNQWFARTLPNGHQLWASVRSNLIRNGGLNKLPRNFNPETGLCNL